MARLHREGSSHSSNGWWSAIFSLIETADFWREAPEIDRGEVRPEDIATEVFFFPAAAHARKTARLQTRSVCCSGITRRSSRQGDCRSELDFIFKLGPTA